MSGANVESNTARRKGCGGQDSGWALKSLVENIKPVLSMSHPVALLGVNVWKSVTSTSTECAVTAFSLQQGEKFNH